MLSLTPPEPTRETQKPASEAWQRSNGVVSPVGGIGVVILLETHWPLLRRLNRTETFAPCTLGTGAQLTFPERLQHTRRLSLPN